MGLEDLSNTRKILRVQQGLFLNATEDSLRERAGDVWPIDGYLPEFSSNSNSGVFSLELKELGFANLSSFFKSLHDNRSVVAALDVMGSGIFPNSHQFINYSVGVRMSSATDKAFYEKALADYPDESKDIKRSFAANRTVFSGDAYDLATISLLRKYLQNYNLQGFDSIFIKPGAPFHPSDLPEAGNLLFFKSQLRRYYRLLAPDGYLFAQLPQLEQLENPDLGRWHYSYKGVKEELEKEYPFVSIPTLDSSWAETPTMLIRNKVADLAES
jgi:hypothetical protein